MISASVKDQLDCVLIDFAGVTVALLAHQVLSLQGFAEVDQTTPKLSSWLGLTEQEERTSSLLRAFGANQALLTWQTPSDVELVSLPIESIYPLPSLLVQACRLPGIAALAWHEKRLIFLIDLSAQTQVA